MSLPIHTDMITAAAISAAACAVLSPFVFLGRNSYTALSSGLYAVPGFALGAFFFAGLSSPGTILPGILSAAAGIAASKKISSFINASLTETSVIISGVFLSVGVALLDITASGGGINLNSIIFGELSLIPLYRTGMFFTDLGPIGLYVLIAVLALDFLCLWFFYKELKIALFDKGYFESIIYKNDFVKFLFPALAAINVSAAFQVSGAFMTAAFLIIPAATANFYTKRLSAAIAISVIIGFSAALTGYGIAFGFKTSVPGTVICVTACLFFLSLLVAPETGILYKAAAEKTRKEKLLKKIILIDLSNEKTKEYISDCHQISVMAKRLSMREDRLESLINELKAEGEADTEDGEVFLTDKGKIAAVTAAINI